MINKILVPRGIRYISDWEDFYNKFPRIPHIMDKQIPGCGFTEWCLTNPDPVILCSPRNMLILNKWEQHPTDVFRVHYDKYDLDPEVDKDISDERGKKTEQELAAEELMAKLQSERSKSDIEFKRKLERELGDYITKMRRLGKPAKILVTYDSYRILKEILVGKGCLNDFQIIIDEFQSIFTDSRFKSNTELEFVNQLAGTQKVCYVSATPMIDKYLEMIPEFANLPYYELDWETEDPTRVRRPDLEVRIIRSIYEPIKKIIGEYLTGKYVSRVVRDNSGNPYMVESRELMVFVNSVMNIINTIIKTGLKPDQVNILCANTPENQNKIWKKLGKGFNIGKVPLPGEKRKMFTFCTRTVYLGADFYSDNARTVILSDANIDCLAVDISLDLPQILGRQRLESNPWKNSAEFYYKPLIGNSGKLTPEIFEARIKEKVEITESLIRSWTNALDQDKLNLAKVYEDRATDRNYKSDYIAVNNHLGKTKVPVLNNLVMIAERRAYDIQQTDYADRFSVFDAIGNSLYNGADPMLKEASDFLASYNEFSGSVYEKLKMICQAGLSEEAFDEVSQHVEGNIQKYLILGPERIKALGYNITEIKKELGIITFDVDDVAQRIIGAFKEGDRISKADIKTKLKEIYAEVGYEKTAKANDIEEWFEVKEIQFRKDGKVIHGFELTKKKI